MSVILNRILVRASKAFTCHSVYNLPSLSKFNGNFKANSTLAHSYSNKSVDNEISIDDTFHLNQKSTPSVLEELKQEQLPDVSHIGPQLRPSFNFAYYANKSEVIQKLIDLGVNFHVIESRKHLPSFLLHLDFEKDIKPYISFLFEHGVPADQLGEFFTKNPFLFQECLDDLKIRINYLESKKFTPEMITRVITGNPRWLSLTTQNVDRILGNFQKELRLTGEEIRYVVCRCPKIVDVDKERLRGCIFMFKEVIGFDMLQTKNLFLKAPYAWRSNPKAIKERLDVMLIDLEVRLSSIVAQPSGLLCRAHVLKQRHLFLKQLGKAQYDPTKPGYVSIDDISKGNDAEFCDKVAKTSVNTYNLFLKTL